MGSLSACTSCGLLNSRDAGACGECGIVVRQPLATTAAPAAERRQLTVLFCDVVGSTTLSQELDPEDWRDVLINYQALCGRVVEPFEGFVAQYLGDGVLIYFGYPLAQEDAPHRALDSGLAIVRAVAAHQPEALRARGLELQVRVGIHTGSVVVGSMGQAFNGGTPLAFGETLNIAARVQASAAPGSVVLTSATHRLAIGYFTFRELGATQLRGIGRPIGLFSLGERTGARSRIEVTSAALTPFVGREAEMARLLEHWERAKQGEGPVVLLEGDAGIGKSRQMRELRERLASEPMVLLECYCSPLLRNTALHPVRQMLERRLGFTRDLSLDDKWQRLTADIARVGLDGATVAPLLGAFLDLPPKPEHLPLDVPSPKLRQATFDALASWLGASSASAPILFIVEDLHWADPSTLDLMLLVVQRQLSTPMLLIVTTRPGFVPGFESPRLEHLSLHSLSHVDAQRILGQIPGSPSLPVEIVDHVLLKSAGIPLYVEELTKAALEVSHAEMPAGSTAGVVPDTIKDSLMARLDRLGTSKALAQLAATLGASFSFDLLLAVSGARADALRAELGVLVESELLQRNDSTAQETYAFRHALIADTAYESLLRAARQQYHRRVAFTLATKFPDMTAAHPALVAQHYANAGLATKSIEYWARAGEVSLARAAFAEAIHCYGQALELLEKQPASRQRDELEIALRSGIGMAFLTTKGFSAVDVEQTYRRAAELCHDLDNTPLRVAYGIWAVNVVRGDLSATQRMLPHFELLTGRAGRREERLVAYSCLGTWAHWRGDWPSVLVHGRAAMALYDAADPRRQHEILVREYGCDSPLYGQVLVAWAQAYTGLGDQAWLTLQDALELARRIGDPYVLAMVQTISAYLYMDLGEPELALSMADEARALSQAKDYVFWLASASVAGGRVLVARGEHDGGIERMRFGLEVFRAMAHDYPLYTALLAEAHLTAGQLDEADGHAQSALERIPTHLDRSVEPELWRLRAEIALARGHVDEAEKNFHRALKLSTERGARLLELRATLGLCRLLKRRREAERARELLTAVFGSFAAGQRTADLRVGERLLAEL
jgi:class 3 adenylate cyclase/tetratricopeptide (TPR) repeat protein